MPTRLRTVRVKPMRRWLLPLVICLWLACGTPLDAQDTGQICVQAFDDRDGNGRRDGDEAPIFRGIVASLLDDRSITIASRLLEDSPFAADGLLCLDQVEAGDYLVVLTSSEYIATTSSVISASVRPGTAPARLDFGVRSLFAAPERDDPAGDFALDPAALEGALVAALGSGITLIGMTVIGILVYFLVLRRRLRRIQFAAMAPPRAPLMPAAAASGSTFQTGGGMRVNPPPPDPHQGSPPLFVDDDETDSAPARWQPN